MFFENFTGIDRRSQNHPRLRHLEDLSSQTIEKIALITNVSSLLQLPEHSRFDCHDYDATVAIKLKLFPAILYVLDIVGKLIDF